MYHIVQKLFNSGLFAVRSINISLPRQTPYPNIGFSLIISVEVFQMTLRGSFSILSKLNLSWPFMNSVVIVVTTIIVGSNNFGR